MVQLAIENRMPGSACNTPGMTPEGSVPMQPKSTYSVIPVNSKIALDMVVKYHYLHRRTSIVHAFGLQVNDEIKGIVTFGIPSSREMQMGACPSDPDRVVELNRLWVSDDMPRNTESWFLARALASLPPLIVVSYADTAVGHMGIVYRASNFKYAGWTDMERKTPRNDYVTEGKHSRDTFRNGTGATATKIPRRPKVKYWTVTGTARDKKALRQQVGWPSICWKSIPPPTEHQQLRLGR